MSDQISQLEKERDYWKRVASYLASCHAATLSYDGMLKGISKSRRDRFVSITRIAGEMMEGKDWRAGSSYAHSSPENAARYCQDALVDFPEVR